MATKVITFIVRPPLPNMVDALGDICSRVVFQTGANVIIDSAADGNHVLTIGQGTTDEQVEEAADMLKKHFPIHGFEIISEAIKD